MAMWRGLSYGCASPLMMMMKKWKGAGEVRVCL